MLFAGGGSSEDHHDSTTSTGGNGSPPTILSPCSLTSPKALATGLTTRAAPPGASPRHGVDDHTNTPDSPRDEEDHHAEAGSCTSTSGNQEADSDVASHCSSNTTPRVSTGRTPTFAFFKRSFSASASLAGMNSGGHGSVSASTTPSSQGVTGLTIKKKRGFPTLTPRGNTTCPLPPTGMPPPSSARSLAKQHLGGGSNSKQLSSPAAFGGLMARLRRLATVPTLDDDCSTDTTGTDGGGENGILPRTNSGPELGRRASAPQPLGGCPMSLSTMDFQYDGNKIVDYLYVGGENIPSQDALADTFNITHIVNTTMKGFYPHHDPAEGDYVQLFMLDALSQDINRERLEAAFAMIEKARASGHACLVHCRNGMSRSTTICIAYLMKYYQMPLLEAFNFIRERRPCTSPNPGFMRQLAVYEKEWLGTSLPTHPPTHPSMCLSPTNPPTHPPMCLFSLYPPIRPCVALPP